MVLNVKKAEVKSWGKENLTSIEVHKEIVYNLSENKLARIRKYAIAKPE